MKKIFIIFIAMLLPLLASADDSGTCGDNLTWSHEETTKTLTISGTGAMTDYFIGDSHAPWYKYRNKIQSAIIKPGVTSIGSFAFQNCNSLTSITIPNSVISIGHDAFQTCGLTSIDIPNSVTNIEHYAFYGCSHLTTLTIPSSVKSVGDHAFSRCRGLISVTISNGVTSIGGSAFFECISLTSVAIPNSVTNIGDHVFNGCTNLTSVTIPNGVTSIGRLSFYNCSSLTSIDIPNGVTSIDAFAFYGCSSLTSISIPSSVISIGICAFQNCSSLTSITIPSSVTSIYSEAFSGCSGLTSISIPNSVKFIGSHAFKCTGWYNNQSNGILYLDNWLICCKGEKPTGMIAVSEGTEGIAESAFSGCSGLISVFIPNSVTSIGGSAFSGCSGLTSIIIPKGVTNIRQSLFYNCSNLISVNIPNSMTSIESSAFGNCSSLTSVTIPNSVTSIGGSAFYGCSSLKSIVSLNNTPPSCQQSDNGGYFQFYSVDKANSVVWVPRGSTKAYKDADGWKEFQNFKELPLGDVNLDFEVDQDDLNAIVNHIMGNDPEGFYESLADLNGDDKVNAADVVKLVTILNIQDGLSLDWQANYNSQVISSLSCTLNNDGDKAIQLTKCELYFNDKLVSSSNFKVTLATGECKKCSFDNLANYSAKTGFSVVWRYTYNGEDYTYCCDLTE